MNKLFRVQVSTGLPRQRNYRNSFTVLCSAPSEARARYDAGAFVQSRLKKQEYKARAESAEFLCDTPDLLCRFEYRYEVNQSFSPITSYQ